MSKKSLRTQSLQPTVTKDRTKNEVGSKCEQHLAFSFKYLTANKKNNFSYFNNEKSRFQAEHFLVEKFCELTKENWDYWLRQGKKTGAETLQYSEINISPGNNYKLESDETIYVFRFNSGNYRILGFKKSPCSTYNIIGFDFAFNAYNHGS